VLTTAELADSVQHLLVVTGQPTAAVAYGAVQAERARRRQSVGAAVAARHQVSGLGAGPLGAIAKAKPRTTADGNKPSTSKLNDRFGGIWPGEG